MIAGYVRKHLVPYVDLPLLLGGLLLLVAGTSWLQKTWGVILFVGFAFRPVLEVMVASREHREVEGAELEAADPSMRLPVPPPVAQRVRLAARHPWVLWGLSIGIGGVLSAALLWVFIDVGVKLFGAEVGVLGAVIGSAMGAVAACLLVIPRLLDRSVLPVLADRGYELSGVVEARVADRLKDAKYAMLEPEFTKRILHWDRPCLDTTAFAYTLAGQCDEAELLQAVRNRAPTLMQRLAGFFDESSGGFCQYEGGPPTTYATHFALQIARNIEKPSPANLEREPLGAGQVTHYIEESQLKAAVDFVLRAHDVEGTGGFFLSPFVYGGAGAERSKPTVTSTHSAAVFLWEQDLLEDELRESVLRFLTEECFNHRDGGFADTPGERALGCSTFLSLSLLNYYLGPPGQAWLCEHIERLREFFHGVWKTGSHAENGETVEWGAFAPHRDSDLPSVIQTAYASACLVDFLSDTDYVDADRISRILSYLGLCAADPFYGFKFHFGLGFTPNVFATRSALSALRVLRRDAEAQNKAHLPEVDASLTYHKPRASAFLRMLLRPAEGGEPIPRNLVTPGYVFLSDVASTLLRRTIVGPLVPISAAIVGRWKAEAAAPLANADG